ncbi:hypothetical protein PCE1_003428 [Barthelona sp. PCE]
MTTYIEDISMLKSICQNDAMDKASLSFFTYDDEYHFVDIPSYAPCDFAPFIEAFFSVNLPKHIHNILINHTLLKTDKMVDLVPEDFKSTPEWITSVPIELRIWYIRILSWMHAEFDADFNPELGRYLAESLNTLDLGDDKNVSMCNLFLKDIFWNAGTPEFLDNFVRSLESVGATVFLMSSYALDKIKKRNLVFDSIMPFCKYIEMDEKFLTERSIVAFINGAKFMMSPIADNMFLRRRIEYYTEHADDYKKRPFDMFADSLFLNCFGEYLVESARELSVLKPPERKPRNDDLKNLNSRIAMNQNKEKRQLITGQRWMMKK